jgi:hypothetical protein
LRKEVPYSIFAGHERDAAGLGTKRTPPPKKQHPFIWTVN